MAERKPTAVLALRAAEKALRPFYDAVFNDNGDITVSGPHPYEDAVQGYFAYKKIAAALAAQPEESAQPRGFFSSYDALELVRQFRSAEDDEAPGLFSQIEALLAHHRAPTDGWVTVPREPTTRQAAIIARGVTAGKGDFASCAQTYRDVISATPAAPGRRWRHKKRGSTYTEIGRGNIQAEHWRSPTPCGVYVEPVDMSAVVIYRADEDGSLWVRPVEEFEDGRFEPPPSAPAKEA